MTSVPVTGRKIGCASAEGRPSLVVTTRIIVPWGVGLT